MTIIKMYGNGKWKKAIQRKAKETACKQQWQILCDQKETSIYNKFVLLLYNRPWGEYVRMLLVCPGIISPLIM